MAVHTSAVFRPYRNSVQSLPASAFVTSIAIIIRNRVGSDRLATIHDGAWKTVVVLVRTPESQSFSPAHLFSLYIAGAVWANLSNLCGTCTRYSPVPNVTDLALRSENMPSAFRC